MMRRRREIDWCNEHQQIVKMTTAKPFKPGNCWDALPWNHHHSSAVKTIVWWFCPKSSQSTHSNRKSTRKKTHGLIIRYIVPVIASIIISILQIERPHIQRRVTTAEAEAAPPIEWMAGWAGDIHCPQSSDRVNEREIPSFYYSLHKWSKYPMTFAIFSIHNKLVGCKTASFT